MPVVNVIYEQSLIVDKESIGFGGDAAPDKALSKKQRKTRLQALMDACRAWVQGMLLSALAARITETPGPDGWRLEIDPDMPDGQCLLFGEFSHLPLRHPCSTLQEK